MKKFNDHFSLKKDIGDKSIPARMNAVGCCYETFEACSSLIKPWTLGLN